MQSKAFKELIKFIKEYSSDTFDAKRDQMTAQEAEQIANQLVDEEIHNLMKRTDGFVVAYYLHQLRGGI